MKRALILLPLLLAACSKTGPIEAGSEVKFHYKLTVDGAVIDSSEGKEPLAYKQGAGMIVPGLERQLAGKRAGERFTAVVEAKDGYGEHQPAGVKTVPWPAFGGEKAARKLTVGETVSGQADGRPFPAKVVGFKGDGVQLDLNHPLAGKKLEFAVEVVEVRKGQ